PGSVRTNSRFVLTWMVTLFWRRLFRTRKWLEPRFFAAMSGRSRCCRRTPAASGGLHLGEHVEDRLLLDVAFRAAALVGVRPEQPLGLAAQCVDGDLVQRWLTEVRPGSRHARGDRGQPFA